jgi:hypothetical protein
MLMKLSFRLLCNLFLAFELIARSSNSLKKPRRTLPECQFQMYRHVYTEWGSVLAALLKIHTLLKFIQSDVYLKTNVCHY